MNAGSSDACIRQRYEHFESCTGVTKQIGRSLIYIFPFDHHMPGLRSYRSTPVTTLA